MKRILITGENSYIGTSVENWLTNHDNEYRVDTISVRGEEWLLYDFSTYDVVLHVAGIAHADVGNISETEKQDYYDVNCDLTYKVASMFKNQTHDKITQFIFMSSIIVYGQQTDVLKKRVISADTIPKPDNFYGDSKLKAENKLLELVDSKYLVSIFRPPMIYGPKSKGNYQELAKIAVKTPIFPKFNNMRSMIFIEHLTEFIRESIDAPETGVFFPQNNEYVRTSDMVKEVAETHNKKVFLVSGFSWLIVFLSFFPGKIGSLTKKAFGNLVYEKNIDKKLKSINQRKFTETILISERIIENEK